MVLQLRRYIPLFCLIIIALTVYIMGWHQFLSFDSLKENRALLQSYVQNYYIISLAIFMAVYVCVVALSLPGATILSISAGFLFGTIAGTFFTVLAATAGACLIFLIAKTSFGESLEKRASHFLHKMRSGFQDNAFSYLLTLRLVPLFPFFIVNLVPALLGMRLRDYAVATFLGIIPGAFVYVSVGTGLGSVFESGEAFNVKSILTPEILVALLGLGCLSLLPVILKFIKSRR